MDEIFLSYRREDSSGRVHWLKMQLDNRLGPNAAFLDTTSIQPGASWPERLRHALGAARAVLVVIGPRWLSATDEWFRRRIDDENDWVRQEVQLALEQGTRVVPVLVDGAVMPPRASLPAELAGLSDRQAVEIRDAGDVDGLLAGFDVVPPARPDLGSIVGVTRTGGPLLLPIYLVIDSSYPMRGPGMAGVNQILPEVADTLAVNPVMSDRANLSLISFADRADLVLPLCDPAELQHFPRVVPGGGRRFGPAFELLRDRMDADAAALRVRGQRLAAPLVILVTSGPPDDPPSRWRSAFRRLVEATPNRPAPIIVPFGVGNADLAMLREFVSPVGRSTCYVARDGVSVSDALRSLSEALIDSYLMSAGDPPAGSEAVWRGALVLDSPQPDVVRRDELEVLSKIGQGGEGSVFEVGGAATRDGLVYKEYRQPIDPSREAHLKSLVAWRRDASAHVRRLVDESTAWPRALVTSGGDVTGFLMRAVPLHFTGTMRLPSGRLTRLPKEAQFLFVDEDFRDFSGMDIPADLATRLSISERFARLLAELHGAGIVLGDISAKNVLYTTTPEPAVFLFDCDGAAIVGRPAPPAIDSPDWQAPEMVNSVATHRAHTRGTDRYKLALFILRCLTPGRGSSVNHSPWTARHLVDRRGLDLLVAGLAADPDARPDAEQWRYWLAETIRREPGRPPQGLPVDDDDFV